MHNPFPDITEIQTDIRTIEANSGLHEEAEFDSRADAIDFIEFHILDRIEGIMQRGEKVKDLALLKQHAEKIKRALEKTNSSLFDDLRKKIRNGVCTKTSFLELICQYAGNHINDTDRLDKSGYDNLDVFINGLLSNHPFPGTTKDAEPEMVFFQKTPAKIIFEMIRLARLTPDDVFFDIGSGLGQIPILVNLISGASTMGIEYDQFYCNYAKASATQLNLSGVEFINLDARKADYSRGTVFFLYTPFEGSVLQEMLDILQKESQKRPVRIFTYGPCSSHTAGQDWLICVNGKPDNPDKLCLYLATCLHAYEKNN